MKIFFCITLAVLLSSCASSNKELDQKKSNIYFSHGTEKLLEKDYTEALKNLIEAKNLDPKNPKILNNLAMAYYLKGKPQIAKKYFIESLELDEKNSDARNNLASIYFTEKKYNEAEIEYKKILDDLLYDHSYRALYNLALIEFERRNLSSAIAYLEKSAGMRADYCPASYRLAIEYRKSNQVSKSLEYFKIATRENCKTNPEPFYEWGNLLMTLGKEAEAKEKYDYVVEKFPKSALAKNSISKIEYIKKMGRLSINKNETIDSFNSGEF